jgi:hypothetical protein
MTMSAISKLNLDFLSATLDPRITFTRALNTATRINSSGNIEVVNADTARFDYNPITLSCRGLLVEQSRANAYLYSRDYTQVTWQKTGSTINSSAVQLSPDGVSYMQKLEETATTGVHRLAPASTPATINGTFYTLSFFAKKAERDVVEVAETTYTGITVARFNLTTGTAQTFSGLVTATITNFGNGIYRCTCTMAAQSTGNPGFINRIQIYNGASSYTGTLGYGLYIWGCQFETGAFATSYIPTTTAALTRNADVATITGANFSDWWQSGKGGVVVNARPGTVSGIRPWVQFDDGTANEIIALRGNTTNPELYIVDDGSPQAQIDAGTIAANTDYSLTGWWQTNNCAARLNLTAPVFDTSAAIPTVTQMRIGSDGTNYMNGHLASISYYDTLTSYIYTRRKNKVVFSLI